MILTASSLGKFGRMGNILYQTAALIATAKKHGVKFYIPNRIPHQEAITEKILGYNYNTYYLFRLKDHLMDIEVLNLLKKVPGYREYKYLASEYLPIKLDTNTSVWDLLGYFQSHKYFEGAEREIRYTLRIEKDDILAQKLWTLKERYFVRNVIGVGIRLTDYIQTDEFYWNLYKTDYYQRAFKEFQDCVFLVFSDDILLARKIIKDMDLPYYFEFEDEVMHGRIDGFAAYSMCDGYIIANSTFHWWGAWLGDPDYKKKVVAPMNWYKQSSYTAKDLYLSNWIIL